jgi:hypothetical protein
MSVALGSEAVPQDRVAPLELSVVMPCLNEERTLPVCVGKALSTIQRLGIHGEVLIVDNGSTDRSVEIAQAAGARVVHQPLKGYGNALRKGFDEAAGRFIIMGDCDDSYDFTDLERFVVRLRAGAELVMGNRLRGEIKPGAMPWSHRWIGNPVLSRFPQRALSNRRGGFALRHARLYQGSIPQDEPADAGHGDGQRDGHQELAGRAADRRNPHHALARRPRSAPRICAASATAGATCASCSCAARCSCSCCRGCC